MLIRFYIKVLINLMYFFNMETSLNDILYIVSKVDKQNPNLVVLVS